MRNLGIDEILLCDQIIKDSTSGKNSLIGVFDRISAHKFPAGHRQLSLFFRIRGKPKQTVGITIRFTGPQIEPVEFPTKEVRLSENGRSDVNITLMGLVLPAPGEYRFAILLENQEKGETTFEVVEKVEEPQSPEKVSK